MNDKEIAVECYNLAIDSACSSFEKMINDEISKYSPFTKLTLEDMKTRIEIVSHQLREDKITEDMIS